MSRTKNTFFKVSKISNINSRLLSLELEIGLKKRTNLSNGKIIAHAMP
jgi:hypothetical protein